MFQLPDIPTLRLCSMVASLAFAAVFLFVWRARREDAYLPFWAASSATYALILIGFDLLGEHGNVILTSLLFGALPASNLLLVIGVRLFHGRPPLRPWMLLPPVTASLGYLLPSILMDADRGPVAAMTFNTLALAAATSIIGVSLLVDPASQETRGQRIVGAALLGYVPGYLLVIAAHYLYPAGLNFVALIPMLSDQLLLGILNLGLLAMPGERAQRKLRQAALRDPLTKAWNRDGLRARQSKLLRPGAAVVAIDVDCFKQINDSYGHAVGDQVLIAMVELADDLLAREGGELVRLGGDEFAAIIPEPGPTGAQPFAERLQQEIRSKAAAHLPCWTVSLGMAKIFSGEDAIEPALQRADLNLYRAKAAGRNRVAA